MAQITIENLQVTLTAQPGRSLLNTLVYEDQPVHNSCGGRARCGCCQIRILEGKKGISPVNEWEKVRLTAEELVAGWRLACQTHTLRDITVHLPTAEELDPACRKKKERVVQDPALR